MFGQMSDSELQGPPPKQPRLNNADNSGSGASSSGGDGNAIVSMSKDELQKFASECARIGGAAGGAAGAHMALQQQLWCYAKGPMLLHRSIEMLGASCLSTMWLSFLHF